MVYRRALDAKFYVRIVARQPMKPINLYHGSSHEIKGELRPTLKHDIADHIHDKPAVFATERIDVASLFMFPEDILASVGFEQDIAYICIWGKSEEFKIRDKGGYIYVFSNDKFQQVGKDYEWQSFTPVTPKEIKKYSLVIEGIIDCFGQVYFVDDDNIMDKIVANKGDRGSILKDLLSENEKLGKNIRKIK